jgi:hypothetical protein
MAAEPTFAEALRLADEMGLPDKRQAFIEADTRLWGGEKPPCCAIGGANIASGRVQIVPEHGWVPLRQIHAASDWSWIGKQTRRRCPSCGRSVGFQEGGVIAHIYDDHKWSRTQIADWLDSMEATS